MNRRLTKQKIVEKLKTKMKNFCFTIALGLSLSPTIEFFKYYVFNDIEFARIFFIAFCANSVLCFIVIPKKIFFRLIDNAIWNRFYHLMFYLFTMVFAYNVSSYTVRGIPNMVFSYIDSIIYGIIVAYEIRLFLGSLAKFASKFAGFSIPLPSWLITSIANPSSIANIATTTTTTTTPTSQQ